MERFVLKEIVYIFLHEDQLSFAFFYFHVMHFVHPECKYNL